MLYQTVGNEDNIQGWWTKLCMEAEDLEQIPMIVFRQNRRPLMCVLPSALAYAFAGPPVHADPRTVVECMDMGIITLDTLTAWSAEQFYFHLALNTTGENHEES